MKGDHTTQLLWLIALVVSVAIVAHIHAAEQALPEQAAYPASDQAATIPILDEDAVIKASGLTPVKRYKLDDGHGFYLQESPDAAIEFRTNRINLALRTFPDAGNEAKNAAAQEMITKLAAVITGTDGKLIGEAMTGDAALGEHFINGLTVNVSLVGDNDL